MAKLPPKSKKDKDIVFKALKQIKGSSKHLLPEAVVKRAANPNNPLHDYFEWDESKAAHSFRIIQAGELIRACKFIVYKNEIGYQLPKWVHDYRLGPNKSGYVEASELGKRPSDAKQAVLAELDSARNHILRARDMGMVFGFEDEIDGMLHNLIEICKRIGEQAA